MRCLAVDFWASEKRAHIWVRRTVAGSSSGISSGEATFLERDVRVDGTFGGILLCGVCIVVVWRSSL